METLIERVTKLQEENIFLGGPAALFELAGRNQLIILLREGLIPEHKVLDIGCGCLRGGYWLIHFLKSGCYFGIEPNQTMLEAGINTLLDLNLLELKKPRFDNNSNFDCSVFGEKFDFFVARSIWSHASKSQIEKMLDEFVSFSTSEAIFLTSYLRASWLRRDYKGDKWVGKSHKSEAPGLVRHSFRWIKNACEQRNLAVEEIKEKAFNVGNQTWLKIKSKTPQ